MKKALIVEDNAVNQLVATKMISLLGFEVDIAENGQVAIEKFQRSNYDIVLMDCQMPIMDGYSATKLIRKFEQENNRSSIPIVAVTAHANDCDKDQCFDSGMNYYLTKPLVLSEIEKMLRVIFSDNNQFGSGQQTS